MQNNRTLVVSYYFEPFQNPRSIRWTKILKFILRNKIKIDLITCLKPKNKYPSNLNIYYIKNFLIDKFLKRSSIKHKIKNSIIKYFYIYLFKYIIWPDFAFLYIYPFYRKSIKLIKEKKINHIITVSHPFSCHLVGLLIKIKYPNIIWYCDNGDPFSLIDKSNSNNVIFYKYLNFFFEKLVLKKCNKFFVVNEQIKNLYIKKFNYNKNNIVVSEPIVNVNLKNSNKIGKSNKVVNLFYAGEFYKSIRSPKPFFEILSQLLLKYPKLNKKIRCYVFTNSNLFSSFFLKYPHLKKLFIISRTISNKDLTNFIFRETILCNFGNNNKFQIPSKLYEFIGTGLKILNFHYARDFSTAKILSIYPNSLNINLDHNIKYTELYKFLLEKNLKIIKKNFFFRHYRNNLIDRVSSKYFSFI
jgi:hypothetical protein